MAPEVHTRYRVQRLIRMGEWLERHAPSIITAYDAIDEAHDILIDGSVDRETQFYVAGKMTAPLHSLMQCCAELRRDRWNVQRGKDVTLHQPNACPEHEWQVVIEAPKPQINNEEQSNDAV